MACVQRRHQTSNAKTPLERPKMKSLIAAVVAVSSLALLSGCASMNEDQCLVGDWGGQG